MRKARIMFNICVVFEAFLSALMVLPVTLLIEPVVNGVLWIIGKIRRTTTGSWWKTVRPRNPIKVLKDIITRTKNMMKEFRYALTIQAIIWLKDLQ